MAKIDILKSKSTATTATTASSGEGPYSHEETTSTCPICKKHMISALAADETVFFCNEHRITMPLPA